MGKLELQLLTQELANVYADIERLSRRRARAPNNREGYAAGPRRPDVELPIPGCSSPSSLPSELVLLSPWIMTWAIAGAVGIRQVLKTR